MDKAKRPNSEVHSSAGVAEWLSRWPRDHIKNEGLEKQWQVSQWAFGLAGVRVPSPAPFYHLRLILGYFGQRILICAFNSLFLTRRFSILQLWIFPLEIYDYRLRCLEASLVALVYMFDETPATSPPIASFVIGPSFLRMPGLAWSKRINSKIPFAPAM